MAKIKVDGLGWEWEPGTSREAKDRSLWEKEQGLNLAKDETDKKIRESMFNEALGWKSQEKKVDGEKNLTEKKPFADLRKELKELEESLTREGIEYFPLREFREKLENWSDTISLKESAEPDSELSDEFKKVKSSSLQIADEIKNFRKKK